MTELSGSSTTAAAGLRLAGMGLLVLLLAWGCRQEPASLAHVTVYFRGAPVEIDMVVSDASILNIAAGLAGAEVRRLDEKYDPLNSRGELYLLNQERTSRDPELFQLVQRALDVSELTGGHYNLFMAYPQEAYGFGKLYPRPPTAELLKQIMLPIRRATLEAVAEGPLVRMPNDAYGISLNGLLEGHIVDQALAHLKMAGVQQARVQMGAYWSFGPSPDGVGWPVAITHPIDETVAAQLFLENVGMATASVTDQAYTFRAEVYYNNLDPISGLPARMLMSATIIAPTAEFAGALAKAIFTMLPSEGVYLINQLPEVEGLLVDAGGRVWQSDSLAAWRED
ncbi:MAG: FAD:protein FMN transferase [Candidatus Marinimicrobia bacterium]|nr:FAD:protein FMN transferase [Candidatus Neomarinimicrobiota bacterium]